MQLILWKVFVSFEGFYFGVRVCDTIVVGDLLVENVFYDPLRLDGEKPLCDEIAGISPQDSNSKQQCAPSNYLLKMRRVLAHWLQI